MQKEADIKKRAAAAAISCEMCCRIGEDGNSLGKAAIKQDDTMSFNYFLETQKIITKYFEEMTSTKV